jgi:hypothetical protein
MQIGSRHEAQWIRTLKNAGTARRILRHQLVQIGILQNRTKTISIRHTIWRIIAPEAHKKRIRQNVWRTAVLSLLVPVENIQFLE